MHNRISLEGSLNFIGLADIFQILGSNNQAGILQIRSPYVPFSGQIYFVDGDPVNARCGSWKGLDALYALFGWTDGEFEFYEVPVQEKRIIHMGRMELVLNALKMIDDGIIEIMGPKSEASQKAVHGKGLHHDPSGSIPVIKGPLVDYSFIVKEEMFLDGEEVVMEGAFGNWIWVVLDGMVEIKRKTTEGPVIITRLGEGCFVGTFASFSYKENVRNATVTASSHALLGLLDTLRLSGEFSSLSPDFRRLLLSLAGRLRKITDLGIDLFKECYGTDPLLRETEVIIEEGSSGEDLFHILEGKSYVVGNGQKRKVPLITLERGDVFGYLPFMDVGHEPRQASIVASKGLRVEKLDISNLYREYRHLSRLFHNLMDNLTTCVLVTTRQAWELL